MTDVTLRIRGDATGVVRASADASRAVSGIADASQQAGTAGRRAGQQIAEGAGQAEQASQQAAQAMRGLVAAATAAFGTAQIIAAADAYTRMTGALTLATDSAAELAAVQQTLFDIAQATRSDLESTVGLYRGLSGALKEAGATSEQLASITATISQAMAISGTSAEAAAGAITQLGQAFASGALRGDEFNSVNEAAPRLMQALAASLGRGRDELRAMAEQGQLTSDVLARALTGEQARKLAEEFAKLPPTLSQAAQVAQNAFTRMVGEADKATGASASLAAGIIRVSQLIPQAFAEVAGYFDGFAASFDTAASGFDLIGTEARRVVGDIGMTFLTLPQTLGTIFVAIVAEAQLAWTRISALARVLDAELMQVWIGIKAGAVRIFGELALDVAKEFDRVIDTFRKSSGVIATAFSAIPGASTAIRQAAEALGGYESTYQKVAGALANNLISLKRQKEGWEDLANQTRKTANAQIDAITAARDASLRDLDATRQRIAATRAANVAIADSITLTTRSTAATNASAEALRAQAQAAGAVGVALAGASASVGAFAGATASATASQSDLRDASQQAAEDSARYWSGAGDAILRALGDGVVTRFRGTAGELKRIGQQIVSDLIAQFARPIMIRLAASVGLVGSGMASAGGIGGAVNAAAGAAGGGGAGALGGLLGIGGAIGGFTAGLGVAGSAGIVAATQFGAASLAAGNLAVGFGALAGALGPVALALGAIDAITGGRLFGTSYKTDRAGAQFDFGAESASGFSFQEQSRRRSLFRGTRRRTVTEALGEDAQAQIDAVFQAVGQAVATAAGQLGVDIPPRITASFRATTDAQGNVISEVGTILGRQYNESFEVFARRIAAENVIGVLDAALDGEAGRIAEAWRGSADTLADGAEFLLAAATDMRGGFRLLGDASLTGVATLVQRLAGDGESLTAAYQRISGATRLLDEAVALSGVNLNLTREAFVEFATKIAESAGGLERAQSLWASYFQTFYSEQERGLAMLTQARTRGTAQAAGLGLDLSQFTGDGGLQAFRELFESRLPTLTADQVVAWLEFGETLGNITDLQTRYTDAVMQTAETIGQFMSGVDSALAEFAPAATLQQQLADQRAANDEMLARARELGASESELARVRELGDRRINAIIDSVADQTNTLLGSLRMLGIAATGTAEDIAVSASGLSSDFGSLFEEFLGSFYTEAERGAMRQAQAQNNLNAALTAAGFSTDNIISRTELRTRIEQALADGNYKLAESLLRVARAMDQVDSSAGNATSSVNGLAQSQSQLGAGYGGYGNVGSGPEINQFTGLYDGQTPSWEMISAIGFNHRLLDRYNVTLGAFTAAFSGMPDFEEVLSRLLESGWTGGDNTGGGELVDDIERIRQGLRDWLTALTTGDLSPERPRDQLRRAQAEYERLLTLAQGGDAEALQQLQGASELVLRLGRQVFGSSAGYTALYNQILAQVGGLVGFTPGAGAGGPGGGNTRPVDDLGRSATNAAAALDMLASRLGMPAGSLTVPGPQFGGVSDQHAGDAVSRPVVTELQRGRAESAQDNARLRAEIAELSARMDRMSAAAERSAQELARANDLRR